MESVYSISNYIVACQVKFATCTLQGNALTWWNSHIKTTTPEAAYAMPWRTLKKMMTDKYYPRGEMKKLEFKIWNLKVKGIDVVAYSQRFQELALMCDRMLSEEIEKVEKYVDGLPNTIHGSVMATKPKTMQDAIEFATKLMNKKINTWAEPLDANRNDDDSHTSGMGRPMQVSRECTYPDFLKYKPLNFKGTEGVVGLSQWFEKMESVYSISNYTVACQVKFATCTLQGNALTWWNSHIKTTTPEAAYAMPWRTLKKMMTDKYYPRGEMKKLEFKIWNLKVKGIDVVAYSQRFQELALMCDRMLSEEIEKVEKYVDGLPNTIHGSVMATKPKTMQDAIEFATKLMNK
nr:hypothetical protein [Tanacetum cinerariifolium]